MDWSWQRHRGGAGARHYLVARLLRVPVRDLASVIRERDQFRATCLCGWDGEWHPHQDSAFSEAQVHTRYVTTPIDDSTKAAP